MVSGAAIDLVAAEVIIDLVAIKGMIDLVGKIAGRQQYDAQSAPDFHENQPVYRAEWAGMVIKC